MQTAKKILLPYTESGTAMAAIRRQPQRGVLVLILLILVHISACAESLQVLHWWRSTGEQKAVAVLSNRMAQENIQWRDGLVPSGSGIGANIVLKSRVLAGNAPEVAQLNGVLISEWADLGLLLEMDSVAVAGKWEKLLLPSVWSLVQSHGHLVAAPLGVHRTNTLFYNKKIFSKYDLSAPNTWEEFEQIAKKLQQAGIVPLAQSTEPWQLATLFDTILLSESSPAFYQEAFVRKEPAAFYDQRFSRALKRLRTLKKYMVLSAQERTWMEMARQLAEGNAAMMIMGDWVKGELNAMGLVTDVGFGCTAVPETGNYHLYNVDTLVMLAKDNSLRATQEKFAQMLISPALQAEYNQVKGSISVLRNPDLSKMDSCSRASWKLFSRGSSVQVPSLVHRMATDEISKDAIIAEIHRFFMDDQMTIGETQRRLGAIARYLSKTKAGNDAQDINR